MEHLSNETLTELALGRAGAPSEHLEVCDTCRAEVASLRAAMQRVRVADVEPITPPAGLWERIAAEVDEVPDAVGGEGAAHGEAAHGGTARGDTARGDAAGGDAPGRHAAGAAPGAPHRHTNDAVRRGSRRRRFGIGALLAASAASAAVAALVVGVVVTQLGAEPRATDVASAVLEPLGPDVTAASAEVIEVDGQRLLVVDADALPEVDGYLDVWLLDENAQQMVSIGVMDRESTRLTLPAGLDLGTFPIVDVSIEPFDGDPTHSGNSLWRGALET